MNGTERRSTAGHRVQFEALVAVGGSEGGAGFEAESVDVSAEGMRLRTAYLPTVGDRLVCRFDGLEGEVIVEGEVIWATEQQKGGEFAVRFLELDAETREMLRELCFGENEGDAKPAEDKSLAGTRVRLHIEGLGSPMKARVRSGNEKEILVGSSLEFLKLGRTVELEDVDRQNKREGVVDTVKVEVDPESSVPQLVVSLRFEAAPVTKAASVPPPAKAQSSEARSEAPKTKPGIGPEHTSSKSESAKPIVVDTSAKTARAAEDVESSGPGTVRAHGTDEVAEDDDEMDFGKSKLRSAGEKAKQMTSQAVSKIGPAFSGLGSSAKGMWSKVQGNLAKRKEARDEAKRAAAPRRVTAPPPSGALKSSGRKLVRDREENDEMEADSIHIPTHSKKRAAIGAVVGIALIAGIFGVVKATSGGNEPKAPGASASQSAQVVAANGAGGPAMGNVPLFGATPLSTTEQVTPPPPATSAAVAPPSAASQAEGDDDDKSSELAKEWGKGDVKKPNTIKIKMDGDVEGIRGEETDNGFVLHVPGHKAMGSTSNLKSKDKHIDSFDVVAHDDETEITVKFKGEPPGYKARVNGKKVEIEISGDASGKVASAPKSGTKKKQSAQKPAAGAKKKGGKH